MSDTLNLRKSIQSLEKSEQFDGYTKVVVTVSEDVEYSAGDGTGRTLTLTCPFGSQKLADDLLLKVRGFQYQPYTSTGTHVDPAAELGDGVTVGNVYSGIFSKNVSHGPLYTADISAPGGEKVNYEYPYQSPQERIVTRNFKSVRSSLSIQAAQIAAEVEERKSEIESVKGQLIVQAGQIEAKVSKTGGDGSSFGWALDESSWTIKANGSDVLKATKSGLEVNGKIAATSGKIGGLAIESNYLSYNGQTWGGTNTQGLYIGPNGIQLGKNFKVDSAGNLTAASGTFTGNVYAGNIQYGGNYGTLPGSALTSHSVYGSQIGYNTISTAYTSNGINASLANADYAYGCVKGWNTIPALHAGSLDTNDLTIEKRQIDRATIRYMNSSGGVSTAKVLVWI